MLHRRTFVAGGTAGLLAGALPPRGARAQGQWPDRPIRVVVPFAAGGATDVWSRLVTGPMSEALGQPFVIEVRPGAGTMIGTEAVARSPADGYTLLFNITSIVQSPIVFRRTPYDAEADFAPIGKLGGSPLIFAVGPGVPGNTMAEFVEAARGRNYSFGSYAPGSTGHVMTQVLSDTKGLGMTHVGYRGEAPEIIDLIGGRIQCALVSMTLAKEYFRDGRLRPLATIGNRRQPSLPNVPTFEELDYPPEFSLGGFVGLWAPARTPRPVVARLAEAMREAVHRPEVQQRLAAMDFVFEWKGPEAFREEIHDVRTKWAALIDRTGITTE